jgi:hypothetical protein
MIVRVLVLAALSLGLVSFSLGTAGEKGKDDKKDKDKLEKKDKEKEKKPDPKVELKFVTGVIKSIDAAKGGITIAVDGKERSFAVDESTNFVGPKGGSRGMGKAAFKDETLVVGNTIRVGLLAESDKSALEVHLPARGTLPAGSAPPQTVPSQGVPPQVELPFEPPVPRIGPVRRILRRVFGR